MLKEKIREARLYAGIRQQDMADKVGISASSYNRIENGHIQMERADVIRIAHVLNLNENELLTYWIADNIYGFIKKERQLTLNAIDIVTSHIDDYETLIKTFGNKHIDYTFSDRKRRRHIK